jgi:hypothetical protein
MTRMGNLSLMVSLFREQKSGHMHQVHSLFKTITTSEEYGLVLRRITLPLVIPMSYFLFHFFDKMDICRDVH